MSSLLLSLLLLSSTSAYIVRPSTSSFKFSRTSTRLNGWGPDPIWTENSISALTPISTDPDIVSLKIKYDRLSEFTKAGQYIQVQTPGSDDKVSYLAMCNPPESEELSFMVKKSDSTSYLFNSPPSSLQVSQVLGSGFKIGDNIDGFKIDFLVNQVIFVCTGTGIAPIKSLIDSNEINLSESRKGILYWGLSNDSYCESLIEEFKGNENLKVVPVFSNPTVNLGLGMCRILLRRMG